VTRVNRVERSGKCDRFKTQHVFVRTLSVYVWISEPYVKRVSQNSVLPPPLSKVRSQTRNPVSGRLVHVASGIAVHRTVRSPSAGAGARNCRCRRVPQAPVGNTVLNPMLAASQPP
jgi:hypothetical protein